MYPLGFPMQIGKHIYTQSKCNGSNQANIFPTMKEIQIAKLAQKESSNCKGTFSWCDVGIAWVAVHCAAISSIAI